MVNERTLCVVCAWRKDCQKKFLRTESSLRCADYSRDMSIKDMSSKDGVKSNGTKEIGGDNS